mgnify:CR=1 FL=1
MSGQTVERIDVVLGERSYPVYAGTSLLERVGPLALEHGLGRRGLVISNETVGTLYAPVVMKSLHKAGFQVEYASVPDGEAYKSAASAAALYDACVAAGLDRSSFIVALGGGVIGDLAGFVAATYMRGIDYVQVPTTLLAQVDASVGGKTAINHGGIKNLVGAFHQPRFVAADISTLVSLPQREYRAGLAEVVKHGLIADAELFRFAEEQWFALLRVEAGAALRAVVRSVQIKAEVVSADEREAGRRALLNFGHTVGHAIEAASNYELLHGEAVAIGMVVEARLSADRGLMPAAQVQRVKALLDRLTLPTHTDGIEFGPVREAMAKDKKARDGRLNFALLHGIGSALLVHDVSPAEVERAYDACRRAPAPGKEDASACACS